MKIIQLFRKNRERAHQDIDDFGLAVVKIDQLFAQCFVVHLLTELLDGIERQRRENLAQIQVQRNSAQTVLVRVKG
jgi:hypothetical protein